MRYILLLLIKIYQYAISPHFPPSCRYYPSCSAYAYEAVEKFGILRGCYMAVKRIMRCHPFRSGGYDPVPDSPVLVLNNLLQNKKLYIKGI